MSYLLENDLILILQGGNLELTELPVELCELADELIESCDNNYLRGTDDYEITELFLSIAAPRFTECRNLDFRSPIVKHNFEILLLLTMSLKLSLVSRPNRNRTA